MAQQHDDMKELGRIEKNPYKEGAAGYVKRDDGSSRTKGNPVANGKIKRS